MFGKVLRNARTIFHPRVYHYQRFNGYFVYLRANSWASFKRLDAHGLASADTTRGRLKLELYFVNQRFSRIRGDLCLRARSHTPALKNIRYYPQTCLLSLVFNYTFFLIEIMFIIKKTHFVTIFNWHPTISSLF